MMTALQEGEKGVFKLAKKHVANYLLLCSTYNALKNCSYSVSLQELVHQRSYWRRSGEYVQRRVWFINIQSSLHENVVFSVSARMGNAAYIIFIMLNFISGLDVWYHFPFNISCGVAVKVRGHQKKNRVIYKRRGGGGKIIQKGRPIFEVIFIVG